MDMSIFVVGITALMLKIFIVLILVWSKICIFITCLVNDYSINTMY